ncbi:MAG: BON domain-containing protein [Gemmatimonadetes bacterium]|nr:BON domain-containing protein [Gemmatimonadota bacterium]
MAGRYTGDIFDFSGMTDDELYDVVVQELKEHPELDAGWVDVRVKDGHVTLSGRVGSDSEVSVAEQVITEILGLPGFTNELMVDELHRGEAPEAADDAVAQDQEVQAQYGESNENQSDTAAHLVEDLEAQTYGTHSLTDAVTDGAPYSPPDRPTGEGYGSRESH